MSKRYMDTDEVDTCFFIKLAALDDENKRMHAREAAIENATGIVFPRCPVCGGRRHKITLGNACAYCGKVGK